MSNYGKHRENMTYLIAITTILVFLAASYGWGYAAMRMAAHNEVNYICFLSVVGVACLIFLGGILNLAGIAYPATMYALLLLGLIYFMLSFIARFKMLPQLIRPSLSDDSARTISLFDRLLPQSLVAITVLFFALTLLPSNIFNLGDDFQTYIPRPVRMLQTGTLAGDPYEVLGLDSLGAQAFLQGFFLLKLSVEYLPGFDTVFGLGLAGSLLIATARKFNLSWVYAVSAILTFIVINPQSVNVSALYSGTFIILGLLLTSFLLSEKLNEYGIAKSLSMAALAGIFISALIALKTTLIFFAAIYYLIFCMGLFAIAQNKRRALLLSATMGVTATIAILPWLLLHLPNYLAALNIFHTTPETNASGFSLPKSNVSELFSTHDLFYGGSMLGYGTIILVLTVLGVFSIFFISRNRNHSQQLGHYLVSASGCAAAIATYFLNGLFFAPEVAIRYSCPVLIGTLPFVLLASSATLSHASPQPGSLAQTPLKMAVLAGSALVFALFISNFFDRIERAYNKRTTISYPISDANIQYNQYVLSEEARQTIRTIQYQTSPGSKILAWITMPLHLDFARNKIQTVMDPGLLNPWLGMPLNGNTGDMVQYLKKQGIRYILWQYQGNGMRNPDELKRMLFARYPIYRRIAERNLYMRNMFISIMAEGTFLYHMNGIVLFDLNQIN